jgi:hypothetical protein
MDYTSIVEPHQGKTKTSKECKGTFIESKGEISGEVRIIKGWHAISHAVYLQSCVDFRALNT